MDIPRSSGVLMHVTSLPGPHGIGDLGPWARRFIQWLAGAGQSWWQVLPLSPPGPGHSPYAGTSAFACDPMLISLEDLVDDGLLRHEDLADPPSVPDYTVSFSEAIEYKTSRLRLAFEAYDNFQETLDPELEPGFAAFRRAEKSWLDDFCLMEAYGRGRGGDWRRWRGPMRFRDAKTLDLVRQNLSCEIEYHAFLQFLFRRQWDRLREHARRHGVGIIGDVPIFVTGGSTDVWSRPEIFQLDEQLDPTHVAGVPPDYFSEEGQLWGHPLYDWDELERRDYDWWTDRLRSTFTLYDIARIDHFRGFEAYWSIPAGAETALEGEWRKGPGRRVFDAAREALGDLPLIAEDLGTITPEVHELRTALELPGMAVLQFAFLGGAHSTHLPHHHREDQVVYTGTHDNNTTVGWFLSDIGDQERSQLQRYLATDGTDIHWELIRAALASVARLSIIPVQDLAGLGSDCRMNTPGEEKKQWRFRLVPWMLTDENQEKMREMTELYERGRKRRDM